MVVRWNQIACGLSMILVNYNIAINSYSIILLERTHSIEFYNHPTIIHATVVLGLSIGIFLFGFLNIVALNLRVSFKICSVLCNTTSSALTWDHCSRIFLYLSIFNFTSAPYFLRSILPIFEFAFPCALNSFSFSSSFRVRFVFSHN